jgi:HEAT repeat protein
MGKARSVDAKLSRLHVLRREPPSAGQQAELRAALADKSNLVVAEAAEIIGERLLADLAPELVAAFDRFLGEQAASDKLCRAKCAIVEALNQVEYDGADVFLRAIRHVQMEPRWGGEDDAAAPLRGSAAFGLVRLKHPGVLILLADLLTDEEKVARLAAVQAPGRDATVRCRPTAALQGARRRQGARGDRRVPGGPHYRGPRGVAGVRGGIPRCAE